jgi:hypothetical protein
VKKLHFIYLFLIIFLLVGCSQEKAQQMTEPPAMFLKANDEEYLMVQGGFTWTVKKRFETNVITTDAASPNQIANNLNPIIVDKGSELEFITAGDPTISVYLWNSEEIVEEVPYQDNHFFAPGEEGIYTYEARGVWENGDSSYTIVIEVE